MNKLYFGDNLDILADKIPDNYVDLIYLDPPFKSGKTYNIIFQHETIRAKEATAQIRTFEDTWKWGPEAEKNYHGLINGTITREKPTQKLVDLMKSLRTYLDEFSIMAYLSMMAPRLLEMKRVLKNTGSIYLHCDPTASHYLKLLMDAVFGVDNFRNEIIWHYRRWTAVANRFQKLHDIILFYSKTNKCFFNPLFEPYGEWIKKDYGYVDEKERRWRWHTVKGKRYKVYLEDEERGVKIGDVWQIPPIGSTAKERIGYPTQKPEKLLEKIIKASSNEGDLVLDPFCGCGTALAVAEKLGRRWVGIDITYLAIDVICKRLKDTGLKEGIDFVIEGEPKDVYSAKKLAKSNPFQFQIWCVSRLNAFSSERKSGDQGVDGIVNFIEMARKSKIGKGIIQVKGTENVNPSMVRDLKGTMKSQDADFGILITFKKPTIGMIKEATKEGYLKYIAKEIPKIQFLTVEDLFKEPIPVILPGGLLPPYKRPAIKKEQHEFKF